MARNIIELQLRTVATVRPGDTLVVATNEPLSGDTAEEMADGLRQLLPGVDPVIIHATALAVYRDDQPGEVSAGTFANPNRVICTRCQHGHDCAQG